MTTTTDEILTTLSIGTPSDDPLDISESTESISDQEENGLITWIMIFSAAGLVFIVLLVAAIIFCKRKENKRQGIPESQPLRFILLNPKAVGIYISNDVHPFLLKNINEKFRHFLQNF